MKLLTATFAALVMAASGALAHDYKTGKLSIAHPMALETPKNAKAGAGYMVITNEGDTDDTLLEARGDFPKVMLHNTRVDDQGIARMSHMMSVPIPAGASVEFKPRGMHVMFMGLNGDPLEAGEEFPITLVFEKAGEVEVVFKVEKRQAGGMEHSDHSEQSDKTN
ncbi:MAG: copper chaperone PCu(A)C [Pseudomonadota bacterium]